MSLGGEKQLQKTSLRPPGSVVPTRLLNKETECKRRGDITTFINRGRAKRRRPPPDHSALVEAEKHCSRAGEIRLSMTKMIDSVPWTAYDFYSKRMADAAGFAAVGGASRSSNTSDV